jgi:hypothetical protein
MACRHGKKHLASFCREFARHDAVFVHEKATDPAWN